MCSASLSFMMHSLHCLWLSSSSGHASRVNFHGIGFDFTLLCALSRLAFLLTARRNKKKVPRRAQPNSILLPSPAFLCSSYYDFGTYRPKSSDISWLWRLVKKWAQLASKICIEKGNIDLELKCPVVLFSWHLNLLTVESQLLFSRLRHVFYR